MERLTPRAKDFHIGWICALPVEHAAAVHILDEVYDDARRWCGGPYTLGRIGGHHVVIACLPAGLIGTHSAAAIATQMESEFRNIHIRLLVGVGGGVPSKDADVRLGDVVISQPGNGHGGVVQYGFGKAGVGGQFRSTGFLNSPPKALLDAVAELRSRQFRRRGQLATHLSTFDALPGFTRQAAGPDVLFQPHSAHATGAGSCESCDRDAVVERPPRPHRTPMIHYGAIASGTQVIKDGIIRDQRSRELGGILCFEMEAAGLMNTFPCLVVRGLSDYADSHKTKTWQPYAAAVAASCAKEIILLLPTVGRLDGLRREADSVHLTTPRASESSPPVLTRLEKRQKALESLAFDEMGARHATVKTAHAKTCEWLLGRQEYRDWLDPAKTSEHHGFLWIKGKPGAGKSTMMKFLHKRVTSAKRHAKVIRFFYNARGVELERTVPGMYRSLVHQLLIAVPDLQILLDAVAREYSETTPRWNLSEAQGVFHQAIMHLGKIQVVCFIDALDECPEDDIRDMIAYFQDLGQTAKESDIRLLVCFSSRHYPQITIAKAVELTLENQEGHQQDVASYIHSKLRIGISDSVIRIKTQVLQKSSGIFMWVVLVVPMLQKAYDRGRVHALQALLDDIPADIEDVFLDMLQRDGEHVQEMILCLQWILFAARPLRPEELYFAILIGVQPDRIEPWDPRDLTRDTIKRFIINSSKGLAEFTKSDRPTVQFIHQSVRDFLLERGGLGRLASYLGRNFVGQGHEKLRQYCYAYMKLAIPRHWQTSWKTIEGRIRFIHEYPFAEYAVANVLHHASEAEQRQIAQDAFLQDFEQQIWILWTEILYGERRISCSDHRPTLISLLLEDDLSTLVVLELRNVVSLDPFRDGTRFLFFLAIYSKHRSVLRVLRSTCSSIQTCLPLPPTEERGAETVIDLTNGMIGGIKQPGLSSLYLAAQNGLAAARVLIESGEAHINWENPSGWTPLREAEAQGRDKVATMLLQDTTDASERPLIGLPLLIWAARTGNETVVEQLLETGAVPVDGTDYRGWSVL